jgi:hypothetical protein
MRIKFSDYDLSEFVVKEGLLLNRAARLIIPSDLGCKFTQKNKIFRSSIWDLEGNLLSASLPKFVNWNENPENFPVPQDLTKCLFYDKIDGSTLILDYVDNEFNARGRGVFDYQSWENASDVDFVLKKYPLVKPFIKDYRQFSLIFEITTPNQRIILNYGDEPDIVLIGAIWKDNYELATQFLLDSLAKEIQVPRPKRYEFPSIDEMLKLVGEDKEIEGVCVYSSGDQQIHKVKAAAYLFKHRLKSAISSFDKIIDLYLLQNKPTVENFSKYITDTFDYELFEMCCENVIKCCALGELAKWTIDNVTEYVKSLPHDGTRESQKNCALKIIETYRDKGLDSLAFSLFNSKKIEDKQFKVLMEKLNK